MGKQRKGLPEKRERETNLKWIIASKLSVIGQIATAKGTLLCYLFGAPTAVFR